MPGKNMNKPAMAPVLLAMALGAAIWVASPFITHHREPWDAGGPYFVSALAGAGLIMGLFQPRQFWRWAVAIYAGQCIAVVALTLLRRGDMGLFVPMGMIILAFYTLLSLAGAAVGAWARRISNRD